MNPPRNTPSRPELLAPAGEREAAYAAFAYGADAVYLGLQRFSARAEATNFTLEELADLVGFAHSQASPLRVYVTLNTLVRGDELPELIETILALAELGIDALIVQDLGLIRLVREYAPGLRLHASTQMAIHSKDGLAAAGLLGIRRAVLAREMTLDEIRELTVDTSVEVEVFTHGALCYSYSGLCLLSSHACGRSGNRGKCAYLCRNHFTDSQSSVGRSPGSNENGLLLSMNDLALGSTVKELVAARVSALKIEGRMKTPRYVAAATHLYRRLLDGDLGNDEKRQIEDDVKTIFSRPWTQFHVHERTAGDVVNPAQLGHLGVPIGRVKDVVRSSDRGDALRFRVSGRELERHDGLNVAIPGRARPYGFAAEQLWRVAPSSTWTREFSAPPGTMVAVELPDRHPPINPGETIYCASSLAVRRRYTWSSPKVGITRSRLPLQVTVCAQPDSLECRASTQRPNASSVTETTLMIKGDFPPARTPGQLETALSKSFSRLGDTPFELKALTVTGDTQRFVPISQLNEIRREITCSLAQILGQERRREAARVTTDVTAQRPADRSDTPRVWKVRIDRVAYADPLMQVASPDELIIDISRDPPDAVEAFLRAWPSDRPLRLALPVVVRAWERDDILSRVNLGLDCGCRAWQAASLSGLRTLREAAGKNRVQELDVSADWPLHVLNHLAAEQLVDLGFTTVTFSPEAGLRELRDALKGTSCPVELIAYQDTPLCISEICMGSLKHNCRRDCRACPESRNKTVLSSRSTPDLIALQDRGRTVLISRAPLSLSGRLSDLAAVGITALRADFVWREYSADKLRDIWTKLRADTPIEHSHIANLDRGLD